MKVFSVAFAVGLWFFVHGEQHLEKRATVNVEYKNLPSDLVLVDEMEPKIYLLVSGPRTRMNRITDGYFKPLEVDLSGARAGTLVRRILDGEFDLPRGTTIKRIYPEVIRVELEARDERKLVVEPTFVGDLDEVAELKRTESTPRFVTVRGPHSALEKLSVIRTKPIDISGRKASFDGTFELRNPCAHCEISPTEVGVKIEILPKVLLKKNRRESKSGAISHRSALASLRAD